jgi:excisionase family DNA binding protein
VDRREELLGRPVLTYRVDEAAKLLGVSRNVAYAAVRDGSIPSLRIGRRFLVPKAALHKLLEQVGEKHAADRAAA